MPAAARVGDMHSCPATTGTVAHVGGSITGPGAATVLIGGQPAALVGDSVTCVGATATIVAGSSSVMIEDMPAARLGDATAHGGSVILGLATVMIGG